MKESRLPRTHFKDSIWLTGCYSLRVAELELDHLLLLVVEDHQAAVRVRPGEQVAHVCRQLKLRDLKTLLMAGPLMPSVMLSLETVNFLRRLYR